MPTKHLFPSALESEVETLKEMYDEVDGDVEEVRVELNKLVDAVDVVVDDVDDVKEGLGAAEARVAELEKVVATLVTLTEAWSEAERERLHQ